MWKGILMRGIVLKASAGTGKTYRLSLEYIASLLKGKDYKDILVMTFTKKATYEIKERILIFLETIYKGEGEELVKNLKDLYPDLIIGKDKIERIYYQISENRDRLKIYTIDGFINNIFKTVVAPYLNIFGYEIISREENKELILKCFEKIVENKEYFKYFERFFQNRTERKIENYIETIQRIIDIRWKFLTLRERELKNEYEKGELKKYIDEIIYIFGEIAKLKSKDDKYHFSRQFFSEFCKEYESGGNIDDILSKKWDIILGEDRCWNGVTLRSSKKLDLEEKKEELDECFENLKIEIAKRIFNNNIKVYEEEILDFISILYDIYDEIKMVNKQFTHLDITSYIFKYLERDELNLVRDGGITEYFKEIFDSNFKTVFIDEFQDTSILQWKIIVAIINRCDNIIAVGDEKQSIYGWRGGEKLLFENLSSILNIEEESMSISYRSCKNIVKVTNLIFTNINRYYKENGLNWNFTKVEGKSEEEGFFEYIQGDEIETGLDKLVESIKNRCNGDYTDVAIIARSNKQLNNIKDRLERERIPCQIDATKSILEHRGVAPIFKFIKYCIYMDRFSLLEFLRDDLIKIDNRELKQLIRGKKRFYSEYLSGILKKVDNVIEKGLETKNFVLNFIEEFGILEIYNEDIDLKNIFYFVEISRRYDDIFELYKNIRNDILDVKYPQISSDLKEAVKLLSIHKSKGLEYETLYYYNSKIRTRTDMGIQFHMELKPPFEKIENYIFIEKKYEKVLSYLEEYQYLGEQERKESEEEINNLYVAVTRAKRNLIIVADDITSELEIGMEGVRDCYGIFSREKDQKILENSSEGIKDILNEIDWEEKELIIENGGENRNIDIELERKRIIGNAIHYYLEFILYDLPEEHKEAKRKTYTKYGSLIGEKRLKTILESGEFISIFEKNKDIFSKDWEYIYPEYEIYHNGELKRIDRLMIKDRLIHIVDYKTGGINEEQLSEYTAIIKEHLKDLGKDKEYKVEKSFLEIKL